MTDNDYSDAIIGIDLGTSTSAIACLVGGRPELFQDAQGDRIVPSVVQIALDGDLLVGSVAKHNAAASGDRTVQEAKRLMGTGETVKLGAETKTPEEIGAIVLRHLVRAAENKLGKNAVRDVVISVPARFENAAREATKRAAELAGLNVLRLINEPTAAALCYGLDRLANNQKVLVFDFGGGTLDVTVLEMFDGVLDVKTSVGDDKLGGKDVDEALTRLFRDVYKDQHGTALPAPSKDRKIAQVLKEEAENAKRQLSSVITLSVDVPQVGEGLAFLLTRQKFEEVCEPLLMRAMMLVNEALSRARLDWKDIDVVLPVGGSSRIPLFRRALEFASGKELREYENPDEAVAKGAAIAAGIEKKAFARNENALVVQDVSPHRLGVATIKQVGAGQFVDDYFSEIIPKDAKLPAMARRTYRASLTADAGTILIRVYEAATDSNLCRDHHRVSELSLSPMISDAASEEVQVEFTYTLDGTLSVAARYVSAPMIKVEGSFDLNRSRAETQESGSGMTPAASLTPDLPMMPFPPPPSGGVPAPPKLTAKQLDGMWRNRPGAAQCVPLLEQAERAAGENPESAAFIKSAGDDLKMALISGTDADVRQKLDALTDVLFDLT